MFKRNPDKEYAEVPVVVMWPGGPSRQQRSPRDFTGTYVCQQCQVPVTGVYRLAAVKKWLCGPCLDAAKPRKGAEDVGNK